MTTNKTKRKWGYWDNLDNQKKELEKLGQALGYNIIEDWYKVVLKDFKEHGLSSLLFNYYKGSYSLLLKTHYSNYNWKEWLFNVTPSSFWTKKENQLKYILWLSEILGYKEEKDWYRITKKDFIDNKGVRLLVIYNGSPSLVVKSLFPQYDWKDWMFNVTPKNVFWKYTENQKEYLLWLGEKLGHTEISDWYKISKKEFLENKGRTLLSLYNNSPILIIKSLLPHYEWKEWLFGMTTQNYWDAFEHHKDFVYWLGKQLDFKEFEEWYNITFESISKNGGEGLLVKHYNSSPSQLMQKVFPNYKWLPWKFKRVPSNTWNTPEFVKEYLDWLGNELGFKTKEDWYNITGKDIKSNYGQSLITHNYDGFIDLIKSAYSNYEWLDWKFKITPQDYWNDTNHQRKYLDWLGNELEFKSKEDWYKVNFNDFINNCGTNLITRFSNSHPYYLLNKVYPKYDWKFWLFNNAPDRIWYDKEKATKFVKWLESKLGLNKLEDWYKISTYDILKHNGNRALSRFNGSQSQLLKFVYPDYNWEEWRFEMTPKDFWNNKHHQLRYLKWVIEDRGFENYEDYYKIREEDIIRLVSFYGSIPNVFKELFPEYEWEEEKFYKGQKTQQYLFELVKKIMEGYTIYYNYKHPSLIFSGSKRKMELDIFIKELNVGIEYQGEQHFEPVTKFGGIKKHLKLLERDIEKRKQCELHGIKLIEIPYYINVDYETINMILGSTIT